MSPIALDAMIFARKVHALQKRKYTGTPYADHLAEVAGIVATVIDDPKAIAASWLHDCVEDQGVQFCTLAAKFGFSVGSAVISLSDLEKGNREKRKAASRERLSHSKGWVQTIKVADLISNTSSIVAHDAKFAPIYLAEKKLMLDVLKDADHRLVEIAREQIATSHANLCSAY